jgi:amino acid adenylation domain-containing protein
MTAELSEAKRDLVAQRFRRRAAVAAPSIPRLAAGRARPLSYAQERIWFMEQAMSGGTNAYTISVVLNLRGPLDAGLLREALAHVAGRQETLRSRIGTAADGLPRITIADEPDVPFSQADVSGAADVDAELDAVMGAVLDAPFALGDEPMLRALLVRAGADRHVLAVAVHHIVFDGWSTVPFTSELMACYTALAEGRAVEPPPLEVQYGDYAAWQRNRLAGGALAKDLDYWRDELAGVPPLELPSDRARPPRQTFAGAGHRFRFSEELTAALTEFGAAHGATPYMTLMALYQVLLHRYSGQEDFAIGSPVAGRIKPELEPLIGMFANVVALRARITGSESFLEVLAAARRTALDAMAHQEVPFEKIVADLDVARDVTRPPLFQVILALQNYDHGAPAGGRQASGPVSASRSSTVPRSTRFELEWYVVETGGELDCLLVYNTDLFSAETVERFARHLETLAHAAVAAPERQVRYLQLVSAEEFDRVAREWSEGPLQQVAPATLDGLVAAQAARTPDAIAVADDMRSLTYAELAAAAGQLAGVLRDQGVRPGDLVGVCLPRSVDLSVALLAALLAGAAYLPLDPDYPADRLTFMLDDAEAPVVLTRRGVLPDTVAITSALYLEDLAGRASAAPADTGAASRAALDGAAYVIYTSGSTGRPKGVVNTHRGIVNRLDWMQRQFGLGADDVVLQKTSSGFDVSVWEFFWPLTVGAKLVLAKPDGHRDPAYLRNLIQSAGVTTVHFVPSMLQAFLVGVAVSTCTSLRRVICSGEALPVDTARAALTALPQVRLANLYGPTEAAIDVSSWDCRFEDLDGLGRIPIGTPIQNMRMYILDPAGLPAPIGVSGELYLGGVGLARGYHRRPSLTAQRFVPDPYGPPGGRLYRTGDLARWRPDGTVDILGRLDHQVKLRGQRIELGEIEAALTAQPGVREAVVLLREDSPGDQRLAAYVVDRAHGADADDADDTPDRLRDALKRTLPEYMVPSSVTILDALPHLASGKLDRSALPAPAVRVRAAADYSEPTTEAQLLVAAIWRELLGVEQIGLDDDFFELGGHSLLAMQVVAMLRKATGSGGIAVLDLFTHKTLREVAALIERPAGAGDRGLLAELKRFVPGRTKLTYVCIPYGGGSAVVFQQLADALPEDCALSAVAIPGRDIGLDQDELPFDELARGCAGEILEKVEGPLALYGHCVGSGLTAAVAQLLAEAGRPLTAVYFGATFPFARPKGLWRTFGGLQKKLGKLRSNQLSANWLKSMGLALNEVEPDQADRIVSTMRQDAQQAEEYFTALLDRGAVQIDGPVISIVGERDRLTDFYQERFREWEFMSSSSAVVSLKEAGHYFLKYRAAELAEIVTKTHVALLDGTIGELTEAGRGPTASWTVEAHHRPQAGQDAVADDAAGSPRREPVRPDMRRFVAVAAGQLVSLIGSAMTQWALPLYVYLNTHSLTLYSVLTVSGLIPVLLVAPMAGAIVDRYDRRVVMLLGDTASALAMLSLGFLLWTHSFHTWEVYPILVAGAVAGTFQRIAYSSAVAQLVPKKYLGHAIGMTQFASGTAQLMVPLVAVGLFAAIGLGGMVALDVVSYAAAIGVVLVVRFPDAMAQQQKEKMTSAIKKGLDYSWRLRGLRSMLLFLAVVNVFLAVPLVLMAPLVLSFAKVSDVAHLSFVGALGAVVGAVAMSVWGGPRVRRMPGVLIAAAALGGSAVVAGSHASLPVIGLGVFGVTLSLGLLNSIYTMIIQVKTPQRFQGRVFALNQVLAWSTLPIGYGLVGPAAAHAFGFGPADVVAGLAILAVVAAAALAPSLRHFDRDMADATPDDVAGMQERGLG